jgi:N-acetylglucosaminyldiphosphoundecaprenol N-acetyl-beta-D-mannosaminyltransferase
MSSVPTTRSSMSGRKVRIGELNIDAVTLDGALARIAELVDGGNGGAVFTPNVDHVVKSDKHVAFRRAYSHADLCLADGMPIVWASRLLGSPLPEKVSGSDLVLPLARLAADREWRVYLLGGRPGVATEAGERMTREFGVRVVGDDAPNVDQEGGSADAEHVLDRIRTARPDLVFVALGAPKQELWIERFGRHIAPAVAIAVGGSLDFFTGRVRRAPPWMSRAGLEWLYRLAQEPRRMWRRYLIEDPRFVAIVARTWRQARRPV